MMVNSKLTVPPAGTVKEGTEKLAVASATTLVCNKDEQQGPLRPGSTALCQLESRLHLASIVASRLLETQR